MLNAFCLCLLLAAAAVCSCRPLGSGQASTTEQQRGSGGSSGGGSGSGGLAALAGAQFHAPNNRGNGGDGGVQSAVASGKLAREPDYPYIAVLLGANRTIWGCGGTLIRPRVVVTAGHCLVDRSGVQAIDPAAVVIGPLSLISDPPSKYEMINVVKVVRHPRYNSSTLQNDIGLLILETPAKTRPVTLATPTAPAVKKGNVLVTAGWGATEDLSYSNELRYTSVPFVPNPECNTRMAGFGLPPVPVTHMCAGGGKDLADSCVGDSGGPLVKRGATPARDVLLGVVSYGPTAFCGLPDANYGTYTSVAKVHTWLQNEFKANKV